MSEPKPPDEETIVKVAIADLGERLPSVARSRIEATVRRIVHWWLERARIRTFVGIIATREARAELEEERSEAL